MRMPARQIETRRSAQSQRLWRTARNQVIAWMWASARLGPAQISRLWHGDIFAGAESRRLFRVPWRIARGWAEYDVTIPDDVRLALAFVWREPFLNFADPVPAFSVFPGGPALSARQIGRILARHRQAKVLNQRPQRPQRQNKGFLNQR